MERLLMFLLLVPMAVQDIFRKELCLWWMLGVGGAGMFYYLVFQGGNLPTAAVRALIGAGLVLISRKNGGVGVGDGILFGGIGEICGITECFGLLCQSVLLSFPVGIFLFIGRKEKNGQIPMAPLVLAAYLLEGVMGRWGG